MRIVAPSSWAYAKKKTLLRVRFENVHRDSIDEVHADAGLLGADGGGAGRISEKSVA